MTIQGHVFPEMCWGCTWLDYSSEKHVFSFSFKLRKADDFRFLETTVMENVNSTSQWRRSGPGHVFPVIRIWWVELRKPLGIKHYHIACDMYAHISSMDSLGKSSNTKQWIILGSWHVCTVHTNANHIYIYIPHISNKNKLHKSYILSMV